MFEAKIKIFTIIEHQYLVQQNHKNALFKGSRTFHIDKRKERKG